MKHGAIALTVMMCWPVFSIVSAACISTRVSHSVQFCTTCLFLVVAPGTFYALYRARFTRDVFMCVPFSSPQIPSPTLHSCMLFPLPYIFIEWLLAVNAGVCVALQGLATPVFFATARLPSFVCPNCQPHRYHGLNSPVLRSLHCICRTWCPPRPFLCRSLCCMMDVFFILLFIFWVVAHTQRTPRSSATTSKLGDWGDLPYDALYRF